jgi:hypothetical protein
MAESTLHAIKMILFDYLQEKPTQKSMKRWLHNDTFGTLNQMRVSIQSTYQTKRVFLKSIDGTIVDCIFISA